MEISGYAFEDDVVIIAGKWKEILEEKGLVINKRKTKIMAVGEGNTIRKRNNRVSTIMSRSNTGRQLVLILR